MPAGHQHELAPGTMLGSYVIEKPLGAGGMGAVYLATDTRLRRPAAIKVLAPGLLADETARRRFTLEAQSASALNHPNIVTVYQIASEAGLDFIAMEYVSGKTLQQLIPKSGMPLADALACAVQIAAALAAAHEVGVVHRDLKPGNVMITERRLVKLVDFGLAKRTQPKAAGAAADVTDTFPITASDHIVGTYSYMAPEQVQGREVDPRTDIWAFGCVLYRMLTGRAAFHHDTTVDTMAAVLAKDPAPPRELNPDIPEPLQRLVLRCLRKNPVERWHSAADLKFVLEDLAHDLAAAPAPAVGRSPWRRRPLALPLAVLLALAAGAISASLVLHRAPVSQPEPVLTRITADGGLSTSPSLSRDGTLLAFASDRGGGGNLDIWLQQVGGREPIRLTSDLADDTDPAISPDGTKVAFRSERSGGGVYVLPSLGGEAVLIAARGRQPRFSPDGRWIAYWAGRESGYTAASAKVFVVEAGGGTPRQVGAAMAAALHPVWSPKGDSLLALARNDAALPEDSGLDWWLLPIDGAPPTKTGVLPYLRARRLFFTGRFPPAPLEWIPESGAVSFAASLGDAQNLWRIELSPSGRFTPLPERVTTGPGLEDNASSALTKTVSRVVFSDARLKYDVWTLPLDTSGASTSGQPSKLTAGAAAEGFPSLSSDGSKLAFISANAALWTLRLRDLHTGKESTLLSSDRYIANAVVSGDGKRVFFSTGGGNLLAMSASGGAADELCRACGTVMGASPDGRRILYEPLDSEDLTAWDSASHASVKIALRRSPNSVLSGDRFSPDGTWVAFHEIDNRAASARIWILPLDGAFPVPSAAWIPIASDTTVNLAPAWSPAGDLLYFLSDRDGFLCIWAQRLNAQKRPSGEPFCVRHFHAARWSLSRLRREPYRIGLSAAPSRLVFALGELTANIWMAETPLPR